MPQRLRPSDKAGVMRPESWVSRGLGECVAIKAARVVEVSTGVCDQNKRRCQSGVPGAVRE